MTHCNATLWNGTERNETQEHERQLKYAKWRTYQSSHLLENVKHEFLDSEGQVDDHYLIEKVRRMEKKHQSFLFKNRMENDGLAVTGLVHRRLFFHVCVCFFCGGNVVQPGTYRMKGLY